MYFQVLSTRDINCNKIDMEIKSLSDFDKKISDFFEKIKNFTSKKSETKLKEKDVSSDIGKELFEDFGLIGGSFAVLVKGAHEPLLLYNTEIVENADINNSDYFWFPYTSIFEVDQALNIDKSFAGVRSLQGLNESPPEFLQ